MSRDILIGIDAGTSVIKAVAFDTSGRQLASASRRNTYATLPGGGVEQDMDRTWTDTAATLRELGGTVPGLAGRTIAVGVTGQGDGTWLLDAANRPIHHGWLWLDARAATEARELASLPGARRVYETCGAGINVCQMRTHLAWMDRHAPELVARADVALHCKDWLYLNLTGIRATDPTEGVFTFGDFRTRTYSDELIEALGLSHHRRLLPPILDGATETHPLGAAAAEATGLAQGTPVSLGYVDIMCSALGAGLHDAEALPGFTILGSTGVHMRFAPDADAVHLNADASGYTMAFPGRAYGQLQTNMAATLNIDWMLGLASEVLASQGVSRDHAALLAGLDALVMEARPGAALYHPYISAAGERGPFAEPFARASFTGLDQSTSWGGMMRSVFDGLALAARDCYGAMGPTPAEIRLTGGAARSTALRTILASALATPVRTVAQDEAGAAGAVMTAGIATGLFRDAADANAAWVRPLLQPAQAPDPTLIPVYDALFEGYLATRRALEPAWQAQAGMRKALQ